MLMNIAKINQISRSKIKFSFDDKTLRQLGFWRNWTTKWKYNQRAKGTKVKVLFQGLHMTHVIFVLVYNFKIYILGIRFNITF
jgi:hypothetical protein